MSPGNCTLDVATKDLNSAVNCQAPLVNIVKTPASFTSKYKSAPGFKGAVRTPDRTCIVFKCWPCPLPSATCKLCLT